MQQFFHYTKVKQNIKEKEALSWYNWLEIDHHHLVFTFRIVTNLRFGHFSTKIFSSSVYLVFYQLALVFSLRYSLAHADWQNMERKYFSNLRNKLRRAEIFFIVLEAAVIIELLKVFISLITNYTQPKMLQLTIRLLLMKQLLLKDA